MEGGQTTHYLALGHKNLYEKTGTVATKHIFAGTQRIAEVKDGVVTYYHNDHLGSPRAVTNTSGTLIASTGTRPFGQPHGSNNPTDYLFTGKELDDTGLYYFAARYYDAVTGRFITEDSWLGLMYEPWTQHLYSYVGNNPLSYVDPTGQMAERADPVSGGAGGMMECPVWLENGAKALDFLAGFSYQYLNSAMGGIPGALGLDSYANSQGYYYQLGRRAGAAAAYSTSAFLTALSIKAMITGGAFSVSGVGAVIGVPVSIAAVAGLGYSSLMGGSAADYLVKSSINGGGSQDGPINPKKVDDKFLRKHGIDAHDLKYDVLGKRAQISRYNIYVDRDGSLWLLENGKKVYVPTGYTIGR